MGFLNFRGYPKERTHVIEGVAGDGEVSFRYKISVYQYFLPYRRQPVEPRSGVEFLKVEFHPVLEHNNISFHENVMCRFDNVVIVKEQVANIKAVLLETLHIVHHVNVLDSFFPAPFPRERHGKPVVQDVVFVHVDIEQVVVA